MLRINHRINFLLILLLLPFSNYSCSDNLSSSVQPDEVKLIYSTKIGWDVYKEGDKFGEKIIVYFNVTQKSTFFEGGNVLLAMP